MSKTISLTDKEITTIFLALSYMEDEINKDSEELKHMETIKKKLFNRIIEIHKGKRNEKVC